MLRQPRSRHVSTTPISTTSRDCSSLCFSSPSRATADSHTLLKPPGRQRHCPAAAALPPPHQQQQLAPTRICYMPEPWSHHPSTQPASIPLLPAFLSPALLLTLAAGCALWLFNWAKTVSTATNNDQHSATPAAPPSDPQVSPAMRWASLQMQQQGYSDTETDSPTPPPPQQHELGPISQLICCMRTPASAPSTESASSAADSIRRTVQHYASAPGTPAITGLIVTYPSSALLVLEGDTSSLCAVLRELLQPLSSTPPTASPSSPSPLGLSPKDARVISLNPEADFRQFNDWHEAHVHTSVNPRRPRDMSLTRMGRQPGGSMSGLGVPGGAGSMPGMGGNDRGMPGMDGGGMPGMPGTGGGGMSGSSSAPGPPLVKAVLSDSEFLEAAEAVTLFVTMVSTKLQGLPGYRQREQFLNELALREPTLPELRTILSLATTQAVPTLPEFLEQFDIEYARYAALALSDSGQQLLEAVQREGAKEHDGAADPAAGEVQRLRFLYHRHLTLQLEQEVARTSPEARESPLAKYYPKLQPARQAPPH